MNWRAHLFIGVASGAVAAYFLQLSLLPALLFTAISAASSLLPDLDIRNSKASQAAYGVALLAVLAAAYSISFAKGKGAAEFLSSFAIIAGALLALDLLFRPRHRGIMHSFAFLAAIAAACYFFLGSLVALAFSIGYFSHLAADWRSIFNR